MKHPTARIHWQSGQPYSVDYEDIYFSTENGLEETAHVFLQGNRLAERWTQLFEDQYQNHFTIAETGFGTGLNFLCAWQLWDRLSGKALPGLNAPTLHFISTEAHPLAHADLQAALALWPQLDRYSAQLLTRYRYMAPGFHRLEFDHGRVILTLLIGDIKDTLPQLKANVDAWFLDGFSPSKNPGMWQADLFRTMASLSTPSTDGGPGTTFSTFTSAGFVKRGLQDAGFKVRKVAGFGRKREMLSGEFGPASPTILETPPVRIGMAKARPKRAIVIGGGIAGCASAYALARRGWQVTLVERHAGLAQEASGNPVGILYPRLAAASAVLGDLALSGYLHTLRLLQASAIEYHACGVFQSGYDDAELARCKAISKQGLPHDVVQYLDANQASGIAGVPISRDGLYFPDAGWINPAAFCTRLAQQEGIEIKTSMQALKLVQAGEGWQVWGADGLIETAEIAIIAGAMESMQFEQTAHCPLEPVRGQVSMLPQTDASSCLKTVVCSDGYISPAHQGLHCAGATFSPGETGTELRMEDQQQNLAMLERMLPGLYRTGQENATDPALQGRAAIRCATPDYLPMAGPLLDSKLLVANPPRHNADPASLPWLAGLYVNTGHGSKGLVNAPLCAELLASAICGEPIPAGKKLLAALDPNRFLLRTMGLKRLVLGLSAFPGTSPR